MKSKIKIKNLKTPLPTKNNLPRRGLCRARFEP
jgi:hypothetical protein